MKVLEYKKPGFKKKLQAACDAFKTSPDLVKIVSGILSDIHSRGDQAVLEYTAKYDKAVLKAKGQQVTEKELSEALKRLPREDKRAIQESIKCVKDFHKKTRPKAWRDKNPHGALVGELFFPIHRVGLYVPGGQVPLVSSVIMSAVLAKVAGVPEVIVCTPPRADGSVDPSLLAALTLCGITKVYKVGGVQAMGAMAYGTKTVPAVDKIFGPGNAFVMEAKRQLFGVVGVDLLPGPSEVMVLADGTANPNYVAADLLAQAEHGTGKEKIYLSVVGQTFLARVTKAIEKQIDALQHNAAIRKVLEKNFVVIVVAKSDQMIEVANFVAPEHLELQVSPKAQNKFLKQITTAGAILVGHDTPTALGDFTAGPSHTLPTDRTGRFSGGMQVIDFMRRTSMVRYDSKSVKKAWPVVKAFSQMEKLDAHGRSVEIRVD